MHHAQEDLPRKIADIAESRQLRLAVAESLTCGRLAASLALGHDTADWFCGGVVAYLPDVKQSVLGVTPGPVVTAQCAEEMAAGCASLFGADVAVSTTGVGGPGTEEDLPAGTVFIGWHAFGETGSARHVFAGDAKQVLDQVVAASLTKLYELMS